MDNIEKLIERARLASDSWLDPGDDVCLGIMTRYYS